MKPLLVALACLLASCALVKQIEPGEQVTGNRLNLTIGGGWNRYGYYYSDPAQVWTLEGMAIDQLLVYSGVANGKAMHFLRDPDAQSNVVFRANMSNEDLVAMFQKLLTRDGSHLSVGRIESFSFDGRKGVRFEFVRVGVRHEFVLRGTTDSLPYGGLGFAVIDKGELFALIYFAPRLAFFPRHKDRVEALARSAKIL